MTVRTDERYFRSTSLPLATFLFAKGEKIAGVSPTDNPSKKEFVFASNNRLDELVDAYKFGERHAEDLLVPVHVYENARNELLDRLNE